MYSDHELLGVTFNKQVPFPRQNSSHPYSCCSFMANSLHVATNCLTSDVIMITSVCGVWHTLSKYRIAQILNFANFGNLNRSRENISTKFFDMRHTADCKSVDGQHPKAKLPNPQETLSERYFQSRHIFADSGQWCSEGRAWPAKVRPAHVTRSRAKCERALVLLAQ